MRITPLDIRKQEFRRVVRGLDADEVAAFLATVADEYEAVLRDNKQLRERVLDLDEKITEYRNMERTLRDTLMTAERVMKEAKDNARKEADLIKRDAEMQARRSIDAHQRQISDLRRQIIELHKEKEAYLARFLGLAEAQIQFIQNHRTDFEELDRRLLEVARQERAPRDAAPATPPEPARSEPVDREERPSDAPAEPPPAWTEPPAPEETGSEGGARARERDEWRDYDPTSWRPDRRQAPPPPPAQPQAVPPPAAAAAAPRADQPESRPAERDAEKRPDPDHDADMGAAVDHFLEPLADADQTSSPLLSKEPPAPGDDDPEEAPVGWADAGAPPWEAGRRFPGEDRP